MTKQVHGWSVPRPRGCQNHTNLKRSPAVRKRRDSSHFIGSVDRNKVGRDASQTCPFRFVVGACSVRCKHRRIQREYVVGFRIDWTSCFYLSPSLPTFARRLRCHRLCKWNRPVDLERRNTLSNEVVLFVGSFPLLSFVLIWTSSSFPFTLTDSTSRDTTTPRTCTRKEPISDRWQPSAYRAG
jgi:hypothetical protein